MLACLLYIRLYSSVTVEHAALLRELIYINSFVADISLIYSKINYCRSTFGAIKRLIICCLLGLISCTRQKYFVCLKVSEFYQETVLNQKY